MKLNFIPQVFYDLIARLIPGSILICCSYIVYFGPTTSMIHLKNIINHTWDFNFLLIITILLIVYILSIILNGFWTLLEKVFGWTKLSFFLNNKNKAWDRTDVNVHEDTQKARIALNLKHNTEDPKFPSTSFIYDYLRLKAPDIGSRFVKIRAECRMCKVLVLGWSILIFLNLFNLHYLPFNEFFIIECFLLLSTIGVFVFLKSLSKKFLIGLRNFWILLHLE